MSVTQEQLDSFHRFATEKAANGDTELSLEECVLLWRAEQEKSETIASINCSLEDIEAGRCQTLEEADADIRSELGFPPRRK